MPKTRPERHFLPKEVREGLALAQDRDRKATGGRLRVQVGRDWYPIRSFDADGFEVALDAAPKLRGHVEIHDGARMLRAALIVAGEPSGDAMRYDFKRITAVRDGAALDYVRDVDAPAGFIAAQ